MKHRGLLARAVRLEDLTYGRAFRGGERYATIWPDLADLDGWDRMKIAVLKETFPGERRVALVPASVPPLVKAGVEVWIESGAGDAAGMLDAQYVEKGAKIVSRAEAFAAD